MSGSANKGWLRWCYSLVESSTNDLGPMDRLLSTASLPLAEELAWNLQPARRLEDLAHC